MHPPETWEKRCSCCGPSTASLSAGRGRNRKSAGGTWPRPSWPRRHHFRSRSAATSSQRSTNRGRHRSRRGGRRTSLQELWVPMPASSQAAQTISSPRCGRCIVDHRLRAFPQPSRCLMRSAMRPGGRSHSRAAQCLPDTTWPRFSTSLPRWISPGSKRGSNSSNATSSVLSRYAISIPWSGCSRTWASSSASRMRGQTWLERHCAGRSPPRHAISWAGTWRTWLTNAIR